MEWIKKMLKCKIRGLHKISIYSEDCVRCGKKVRPAAFRRIQ